MIKKNFIPMKEALVPLESIDGLERLDGELYLLKGGNEPTKPGGSGCNCDCSGGTPGGGSGCNCNC